MEPHTLQKYCKVIRINFYMRFIIILLVFSAWYQEIIKKNNMRQMGKECFNG